MMNGIARRVYVANLPNTNMSPLRNTLRRLLISLSIYPMAAILVKRVHGSRIIKKPKSKDVKIFTIYDLQFIIFSRKITKKNVYEQKKCVIVAYFADFL
jgi:hypothetical protein